MYNQEEVLEEDLKDAVKALELADQELMDAFEWKKSRMRKLRELERELEELKNKI